LEKIGAANPRAYLSAAGVFPSFKSLWCRAAECFYLSVRCYGENHTPRRMGKIFKVFGKTPTPQEAVWGVARLYQMNYSSATTKITKEYPACRIEI
jgi:hypothetical protein